MAIPEIEERLALVKLNDRCSICDRECLLFVVLTESGLAVLLVSRGRVLLLSLLFLGRFGML